MKIFITLIFLFQFSCLCSDEIEWTNINDINFEECFSDTEGHYIFNVESYNLKNDCTLIIRPIYKWSPLKTPFKKDEKYVKKQNERKRII